MLDKIDLKLLELLQEDQSLSIDELSKKVNLSVTPCWRRIKKLKQQKLIKKEVAILDSKKFGLKIEVIVMVKITEHRQNWLQRFSSEFKSKPEVIGFYRTAGNIDYVLHILLPSIEQYDQFYKELTKIDAIKDVSGLLIMENIKSTTKIPLNFMQNKSNN